MEQQYPHFKRLDVLTAIGEQANGSEISALKVTKKKDLVARGFGLPGQVCIVLEYKKAVVGYRFFGNKNKSKINEYIHLFFSSGQVMKEVLS